MSGSMRPQIGGGVVLLVTDGTLELLHPVMDLQVALQGGSRSEVLWGKVGLIMYYHDYSEHH